MRDAKRSLRTPLTPVIRFALIAAFAITVAATKTAFAQTAALTPEACKAYLEIDVSGGIEDLRASRRFDSTREAGTVRALRRFPANAVAYCEEIARRRTLGVGVELMPIAAVSSNLSDAGGVAESAVFMWNPRFIRSVLAAQVNVGALHTGGTHEGATETAGTESDFMLSADLRPGYHFEWGRVNGVVRVMMLPDVNVMYGATASLRLGLHWVAEAGVLFGNLNLTGTSTGNWFNQKIGHFDEVAVAFPMGARYQW